MDMSRKVVEFVDTGSVVVEDVLVRTSEHLFVALANKWSSKLGRTYKSSAVKSKVYRDTDVKAARQRKAKRDKEEKERKKLLPRERKRKTSSEAPKNPKKPKISVKVPNKQT